MQVVATARRMVLSRVTLTQRFKFVNYFTKNNVRSYASAVLKSSFGEIEIPNCTLTQFIWSRPSNWDGLPAVTCGVTGRSYTYGAIRMLAKQGALALLERAALRPGDAIALLLPNIPEYMIAVYAGLDAGITVTFANPLYTVEELQRQFSHANVKCIVTIPPLLEAAAAAAKSLHDYNVTINIGGATQRNQNILGMDDLLSGRYSSELPVLKSTDIAVLPYSSGTTGMPKGVMLTHKNLIANILQSSHPELVNIMSPDDGPQDTVMTVLPFFHIMGFNAIMNLFAYHRGHLVTIPKFTPEDYLRCLETYKPTVLFAVPSLLQFLSSHPAVTEKHLGNVRRVVSGAAPATKSLIDKFREKINREDCIIDQGYGMTETSPVTLYTPQYMPNSKIGSCGQLVASTQARLIDLQSQEDILEAHVSGEILLKGPQLMKGYLNDPAATSKTIDAEGWLHTGDVGYRDEDGYFFIVDRTKELIKVKGNQVSPTELESLILEVPGVLDVAVVGVPDSLAGELPKAFVVIAQGSKITAENIADYVTGKVAPYKRLKGGVVFINAIPRNPSGKILRNALKTQGR